MSYIQFLEFSIRRWWVIVAFAILGTLAGDYWVASNPPQYSSVVSLQLNPSGTNSLLQYAISTGNNNPVSALAASYVEVLHSNTFGELVVQNLGLTVPPDAIARAISASLVANTNILRMTVTWSDPESAQQLAEGVAQTFISESTQTSQDNSSDLTDLQSAARNYETEINGIQPLRDRLQAAVNGGDLTSVAQLTDLDNRLSSLDPSYANLLVEIDRAQGAISSASILDDASPGRASGVISLSRALLFGFLAGVALALALLYVLIQVDDVVRTPEQLVVAAGSAPIVALGRIQTSRRERHNPQGRLVTLTEPRGSPAEAFRTLRTNLRFFGAETPFRSLVVTSGVPQEGKSFVAANLAVTYALGGQRVLLVDCDMRRPTLHAAFGIPRNVGLMDALIDAESWRGGPAGSAAIIPETMTGVREGPVEHLWLLPLGPHPENPSLILSSERFGELVRTMVERWDLVIFDSAPVGPVADTLLLLTHVDAALVVARAGLSRGGSVRNAMQSLAQTGKPVAGVVLNDLQLNPLYRYYGHYSQYYYYYYQHAKDGYYASPEENGTPGGLQNGHHPAVRAKSASNFGGSSHSSQDEK